MQKVHLTSVAHKTPLLELSCMYTQTVKQKVWGEEENGDGYGGEVCHATLTLG